MGYSQELLMAEPRKVQALCSTDETNEAGFRVDHRSIGTVLHMCGLVYFALGAHGRLHLCAFL